ncbi:hypothetical protein [Paraburkholderia mimosarum]|uniref:hypothetical protein n=1 Tax=Paraburkholderia mimosarum TaxID=312026 RepID=UPI0012DD5C68|nr:hypothetical protein [Paraburkholderia mimosarum]
MQYLEVGNLDVCKAGRGYCLTRALLYLGEAIPQTRPDERIIRVWIDGKSPGGCGCSHTTLIRNTKYIFLHDCPLQRRIN